MDWFSIVIYIFQIIFYSGIIFFPIIYTILKRDSFHHIVIFLFKQLNYEPSFIVNLFIFICLRYIPSLIYTFETVRAMSLVCGGMCYSARIALECLSRINLLRGPYTFFAFSTRSKLLYLTISGLVEPAIFIMMGFGLVFGVCSNFCSLKLYRVVPLSLYACFPLVSILVLFVTDNLLPHGIKFHEISNKGIWERKIRFGLCGQRRYLKRRLQSLQPFSMYGGILDYRLFKLVRSVRTSYYFAMMDYSVTLLLCTDL